MSSVAGMQPNISTAPTDVLETVAHELRQPLSNIETIAYYLSLVLPRTDEKIQGQLSRIRQLVEQSNWILSNGVRLAGPLTPAPISMDLAELMTDAIAAPGQPANQVRLVVPDDLPLVRLDPLQGPALAETLLLLFRSLTSPAKPLAIRLSPEHGGVRMDLSAEGAFGPGAVLALESARQIAEAHGGRLTHEAEGNESSVCVVLP